MGATIGRSVFVASTVGSLVKDAVSSIDSMRAGLTAVFSVDASSSHIGESKERTTNGPLVGHFSLTVCKAGLTSKSYGASSISLLFRASFSAPWVLDLFFRANSRIFEAVGFTISPSTEKI